MAHRGFAPSLAALLICTAPAVLADSYVDTFDSGFISPHYWTIDTTEGSTLSAVNGRLEMVQGTGPMVASGAHLAFNFAITGDFTADVDYTLLNWPANNYERAGISTIGPPTPLSAVARVSDPNYAYYGSSEFYASFHLASGVPNQVQSFTATTDSSGRLRMERVGATISNYYWNGGWVLLGSYTNAATQTGPIEHLTFGIWDFTSDTAGVKVAMDNFVLNAPGTDIPPVPEPETWLMLAGGLGLFALRFRRRA